MKKIIAQFIPIIIIFVLLSQSRMLAKFSHSILGKLFAVGIIVFYTYLDKTLGLFVCGLLILYYQSDEIENMLNMETTSPKEQMSNYEELYTTDIKESKGKIYDEFRKQNCQGTALKYKNMDIKNDMADHVFHEIDFTHGKCNPCLESCQYSIIEAKLKTEEKMIPISTSA